MKYTLLINNQIVDRSEKRISPLIDVILICQTSSGLKWNDYHAYNDVRIKNHHTGKTAWKPNEDNLITLKN